MMPQIVNEQAPVPSPAYYRAQARLGPALHLDALTLGNSLHLLTLCRLAVRLAHRRCPPPLLAGPGGAPRADSGESLFLLPVLRMLGRPSHEGMRGWVRPWAPLAPTCRLPFSKDCPPPLSLPLHPAD